MIHQYKYTSLCIDDFACMDENLIANWKESQHFGCIVELGDESINDYERKQWKGGHWSISSGHDL